MQKLEGFEGALDPVAMMVEAIRRASSDAGLSAVPNPDAIRVVSLLSWRYGNPAKFIAEDLGLTPRQLGLSAMGGNTPQTLVNAASREILSGQADLIFLTGGETTRTRARMTKAGVTPDWRTTEDEPVLVSEDLVMNMPEDIAYKTSVERARDMIRPPKARGAESLPGPVSDSCCAAPEMAVWPAVTSASRPFVTSITATRPRSTAVSE